MRDLYSHAPHREHTNERHLVVVGHDAEDVLENGHEVLLVEGLRQCTVTETVDLAENLPQDLEA